MMKGKRLLREKKAQNYLPYEDCCCLVTHFSSVQLLSSVQFSSVAQWCPTLCDPMNRSTPGVCLFPHSPLEDHCSIDG